MSLQDQISTFATRGQEALGSAVRVWTEEAARLSGPLAAVPDVATLTVLVDAWFDLAEQVLATQREAAKAVLQALSAGSTAGPAVGLRVVEGEVLRS